MKALIFQFKDCLPVDDLERLHNELRETIRKDGFIVVDNRFEIREIEIDEVRVI